MPATLTSLTSQQKRTLTFIVGFVLALGLAGGLLYDLNSKRTGANRLRQEVERKERDARNVQLPTLEDQAKWDEQLSRANDVLLADQTVPQFFEEITKVANENGLQRLGITTEETVMNPNEPPKPDEETPASVGVKRYLVVTLKFQGDYEDIARFLGGVSKLLRPVEYRVVDIRRSPPLVDVTIVMNVFKREAA